MIIYPQGGAGRRPGTIFVTDTMKPDGTYPTKVRLFPFSASDGTRWQIMVTNEAPEVQTVDGSDYWAWKAINIEDNSISDIKPYYDTPGGYTPFNDWDLTDIDLNEIQFAQAGDMLFLVHKDFRPIRLTYNIRNLLQFPIPPTLGFWMYPFPNPYVYGDVGTTNREMPFDTPQGDDGKHSITVTTSGAVGDPVTMVTGGGDAFFTSSYIGRVYKFSKSSQTLVVLITGYTSTTIVTGIVVAGSIAASPTSFGYSGGASQNYEEGSWDADKGWPKSVAFFESRSVFASTDNAPDTIWFSQINDILELDARGLEQDAGFSDPVVATDPFSTQLNSEVLNEIRWLSPAKTLTTGTSSREFVVKGPSEAASIGPTNIQTSSEGALGSAYVQARRLESATLFLHRDQKRLMEMVFNFNEDSFQSSNLNILAEHIAVKPLGDRDGQYEEVSTCNFVCMMVQNSPNGITWCLDNNGYLAGMTRERQQQVIAWHRHKLAGVGTISSLDYDPFIQSISVIQVPKDVAPEIGGEPDELWMSVARVTSELNGSGDSVAQKRIFIEKMAFDWQRPDIENGWVTTGDRKSAPVYLDCAIIFNSDDVDPSYPGYISELPHGNGSEVSVVVNGVYYGEYTVTDGTVNLTSDLGDLLGEDWEAIIGYLYLGELIPVTPEVPAQIGSSQGQPRRIDQITINFNKSSGCKFGRATDSFQDLTPNDELEEISFDTVAGDPAVLFTGEKKVVFPTGYESRPKIRIQSHLPFPLVITHIISRMVVYERG